MAKEEDRAGYSVLTGRTKHGEPAATLSEGDRPVGWVSGEGKAQRVGLVGEKFLGGQIYYGQARSEEGRKRLEEEMASVGARPMGKDSPEAGGTISGHPGRGSNWEQRYGKIFGHEDPRI